MAPPKTSRSKRSPAQMIADAVVADRLLSAGWITPAELAAHLGLSEAAALITIRSLQLAAEQSGRRLAQEVRYRIEGAPDAPRRDRRETARSVMTRDAYPPPPPPTEAELAAERWAQAPGAATGWEVSTLGRARSPEGKSVPIHITRVGRDRPQPVVHLGGRTLSIGRLVLLTFGPPPPGGRAVAQRIDGDPWNNRPENLRWVSVAALLNRTSRVVRDPDICGGEPIIRGTRVPVRVLRDLLDAGETVDGVLGAYPQLAREDVAAAQSYRGGADAEE